MIVQDNSYYHLIEVGTMIFGMAQFSDGLASLSLKVDGSGVEKDTIHPGKKIPALMKQIFLNEILCAARGEGSAILLILKLFSQKGHRPVKVMQSQPIAASDQVIPMPAIAGTVGTGYEEPVQDRQENCPFHIKLEFPFRKKPTNNFAHSQLLPEPFKDERRTNFL